MTELIFVVEEAPEGWITNHESTSAANGRLREFN
jgi:hypothetical protein